MQSFHHYVQINIEIMMIVAGATKQGKSTAIGVTVDALKS